MSSFFTLPPGSKKRKRSDKTASSTRDQRQSSKSGSRPAKSRRADRDDSISGSDSEDQSIAGDFDGDTDSDRSSAHEGETGAERRLRLAERYLENVRNEVQTVGFDAEDVDRDLIAERLKENVAESKGRLYRFVAGKYDFARASQAHFRLETESVTGVAVCLPHAYTVSKDMRLVKWELPTPSPRTHSRNARSSGPSPRTRPVKLLSTQGHRNPPKSSNQKPNHHTAAILCVAASPDGRFVATGGEDKKLMIWSAEDLSQLRVFTQHRDTITSLSIERGLNRLYSASNDRTIKTWGLNEQAYVETLFGHQDHVLDVAALSNERCLSVGARDRSVRLWKVVEEIQHVFRGGGGGSGHGRSSHKHGFYAEGSIERVAMIDDETFVTGSDNGSLSLWSSHKKKAIFTFPCAHGVDRPLDPAEAFAEMDLEGRQVPAPPQPRWITALAALPFGDTFVSGSWDGHIRVWQVSADKKRFEAVGTIRAAAEQQQQQVATKAALTDGHTHTSANGQAPVAKLSAVAAVNGTPAQIELELDSSGDREGEPEPSLHGIVNDIAIHERGERGGEGICVVVALGRSHRLGKWQKLDDWRGQNGAVVFEVPLKMNALGNRQKKNRRRERKRIGKRVDAHVNGNKPR